MVMEPAERDLEEEVVERVRLWFRAAYKTLQDDGTGMVTDQVLKIRVANPGADDDGTLCLDVQFEATSYESIDGGRVIGEKF